MCTMWQGSTQFIVLYHVDGLFNVYEDETVIIGIVGTYFFNVAAVFQL